MAKRKIKSSATVSSINNSAILGTYTGKCCDAAVVNNNEMKLNRELFEKLLASDEYKDAMEHKYYIGFLGHPEDPNCQDFKNGCIVMTSLEIQDNDEVMGTFDLLSTPVGLIVKTYIDAGVQFGISIRGAGDVDADGNVDPDTFIFRGFDLVAFPAYNDAVPEYLVAAASDPKYKKIKAALDENLKYITSTTTLDELKATLNPHSAEYKKLEARKQDIGVQDEECPECSDDEKEAITAKKLQAMTEMYMAECEKNSQLEATLASTKAELHAVEATYSRKLKSLKRITASQNQLMQSRLQKVTASNSKLERELRRASDKLEKVEASKSLLKQENSEISKELSKLEQNNLIYRQKIECSSADIDDRDVTISELQEKLNKTVVASTTAKRNASNLDEKVKHLKAEISSSDQTISELEARVMASEEMLHSYQQAYADFYATALGTSVSGLPVTASTSVRELENLIKGATNTSNIPTIPAYGIDEEADEIGCPVDVVDDVNGDNLAIL